MCAEGDVASRVLQLRLLKKQHDDLRERLAQADAELRKLSPHDILQFHIYLERHLADSDSAAKVQEAIVKLLQCLCMVCNVDLPDLSNHGLLDSIRSLLREPHSFTSRLCDTHVSIEDTKGLAQFILSSIQYRRVREKEVNVCYERMHGWISAAYYFAAVSEQAPSVAMELEQKEALLKRVGGSGLARSGRSIFATSLSGRGPAARSPSMTAKVWPAVGVWNRVEQSRSPSPVPNAWNLSSVPGCAARAWSPGAPSFAGPSNVLGARANISPGPSARCPVEIPRLHAEGLLVHSPRPSSRMTSRSPTGHALRLPVTSRQLSAIRLREIA